MGLILGYKDAQYYQEDDGTVWNMAKTVQLDPKTYEPLVCNPEPAQNAEIELQTVKITSLLKCDVCGFVAKNNVGLSAHKRFSHKGGT